MLSQDEQFSRSEILIGRQVSKSITGKPVLSEIDFTVYRGDCCLATGRNGSGKTTLLRLISGVYLPDQGNIKFQDSGLAVRASAGRTNLVEASSYLYPYLTIEENLNLFSRLSGVDANSWRESASELGLSPFLKNLVRECSAGTVKKASLVRALSCEAEVLALDEPFNFLDPEGRTQLLKLIEEKNKLGRAIIISTNLPEIKGLEVTQIWKVENFSLELVQTVKARG